MFAAEADVVTAVTSATLAQGNVFNPDYSGESKAVVRKARATLHCSLTQTGTFGSPQTKVPAFSPRVKVSLVSPLPPVRETGGTKTGKQKDVISPWGV